MFREVVMARSTDPTPRAAALALLGLPETATAAQIVHTYRRLARATHPDATGRTDPAAAQRFTAIHDAYQLLAEPAEHPAADPAADAAADPVGDPGEPPARSYQPGVEPAARWDRPPPPPRGERVFPPGPPIVAGPVIVTPYPDQQQTHPRRRR
jgi:DnaJ domain